MLSGSATTTFAPALNRSDPARSVSCRNAEIYAGGRLRIVIECPRQEIASRRYEYLTKNRNIIATRTKAIDLNADRTGYIAVCVLCHRACTYAKSTEQCGDGHKLIDDFH